MNRNSVICNLIAENENWREICAAKYVKVKEEGNLAIFNYDIFADFHDTVVQEARGIIIDTVNKEVVCWPFRKFGNYGESYADTIDWNTARVQSKIDGSIVKLYYRKDLGEWVWATNGMISADDARLSSFATMTFLDLIKSADNYSKIDFASLNKDYTYIFEVVGPENRIVIIYDRTELYHTGTRNNLTGEEMNIDIGIQKPNEYPLHSLKDCIDAATKLNEEATSVQYEGFVVVDGNWHRVKVKSPEYLYWHHAVDNGNISKEKILGLILSDIDTSEIYKGYPLYEIAVRYYQYKYVETMLAIREVIVASKKLYEEFSHEKKAVALKVRKSRYSMYAFRYLEQDMDIKDCMEDVVRRLKEDNMSFNAFAKLIPDYQKVNVLDEFE